MNERTPSRLRTRLGALLAIGVLLVVPVAVTSSTPSLDGLLDPPSMMITTP